MLNELKHIVKVIFFYLQNGLAYRDIGKFACALWRHNGAAAAHFYFSRMTCKLSQQQQRTVNENQVSRHFYLFIIFITTYSILLI